MAWLSYYGQMFGFPSLTIFDNGSRDPLTLHLLAQAERCGAIVRRDRQKPADFHSKGLHFAEQIREWDRGIDYDFALPVDCDEFIAVIEDDGLSTSRASIMREFAAHKGEQRALRIGTSLFNIPSRAGWFAVDPAFYKGFLPAHSIAVIDNGQHNPSSCLAAGYALTRFTYFHWHNHAFEAMQDRARLKLANSLLDPDDRNALQRYAATPNLPGRHLVDILLEDEQHYLERYNGMLHLYAPWAGSASGLSVHVQNGPILFQGGMMTAPWSAKAYESAHPDVKGGSLGPLMHFLLHGWAKGYRF